MSDNRPVSMTPSSRPTGSDLLAAAGIAAVAALAFSSQILRMPPEVGQFSKYPNAALQYLHGTAQPERLLDFSPLYLGLHIAAFRFLPDPLAWIAGAQIGFLSLAAALLFLLLLRHVGPGFAAAGTAAFVLGKSVMIYGYVLEPESLMIMLLMTLVFFASRDDLPGAAAAGVALTLCMLTRPSFLPLAAVIPAHFWLRRRNPRRFAIAAVLLLLPVLAGAAFIAERNHRLLGAPSLLVMNPGTVFFDCNSPLATGGGAAYPPVVNELVALYPGESDYHHAVFRLVARTITGRDLTPVDANRYWATKATAFVADHPGRFAMLIARRILHVFHRYRWNDLRTEWAAGRVLDRRWFPFVPFAPLSALAVIGLLVGFASWRTFLLPLAVFSNQVALMALTYATDRQRVSLYPFFAFFATVALARLCAGVRWRRASSAALVALMLLFSLDQDLMRDNQRTWDGLTRIGPLVAEALRERDNFEFAAAREKAAQALALGAWAAGKVRPAQLPFAAGELTGTALARLDQAPRSGPAARLDRALLLIDAGRLDEAEAILTDLERAGHTFENLHGRQPEPAYHLGRIAYLRGRHDDAVRLMRLAVRRSPGDPAALAQLACLTDDAVAAGLVVRYFDDLDAAWYLGRACLETGRADRAVQSFSYLAKRLPEFVQAHVNLAAALGAAGRDREAAAVYLAATADRPQTVSLEDQIVPVFARWSRGRSPEADYWYGIVLREYGHFPEALRALEEAAGAGHPAAAGEAKRLKEVIERAARAVLE